MFCLRNCLVLSSASSDWVFESKSIVVRDGMLKVCDCSSDTPCPEIHARNEYIALPLLEACPKDNLIAESIQKNALENATLLIHQPSSLQVAGVASQIGIWPLMAEKLANPNRTESIGSIFHSYTTRRILPGASASFFLVKGSTLEDLEATVLEYDYKTTVQLVVHEGTIVLSRGEFKQFTSRLSLDKYYLAATANVEQPRHSMSAPLDTIESAIEDIRGISPHCLTT